VIIATIACNNYLPKAMFLAQTARQHHPDAMIVLCVVEKKVHAEALACGLFDVIIRASDLYNSEFATLIFKHSVIEAATAIKARLIIWLLSAYCNESLVVYLDPDIWVFSRFNELINELFFDIAVTPHHLRDEEIAEAVQDNVLRTLQCGIFNLGFLAINRSQTAYDFLNWWETRLRMFCYIDFPRGLFVDQKWVDLAMSFFDLCVLRHPGYNVANWNISQRSLEMENGHLVVNGEPLRFLHFSGIDTGRDLWVFRKYAPSPDAFIHKVREAYVRHIGSYDQKLLSQEGWSYDFFDSGERITLETRIACRNNPALLERHPQPFRESNEVFCKKPVELAPLESSVEWLARKNQIPQGSA
jgi:hypothetical protein